MSKTIVIQQKDKETLPYPEITLDQVSLAKGKARNGRTNLVIDPTPFTSPERLSDLVKALPLLGPSLQVEARWILPSMLLQELELLATDRTFKRLPEIIKKWLPYSYSPDHVRLLCLGLKSDEDYLKGLQDFLSTHKPIPASTLVAEYDKLGEATILRQELRRRMGDVLFETLAVAQKTGGLIVSFGERTYKLAAGAGERILKAHSEVKNKVKRKAKIRRALRIAGYVLSLDAVQGMVSSMGLHIPITGDIGVGLLIVGDG